MLFSVIYEFDVPMESSVRRYAFRCRSLRLTERADGEPSEWCSDIWGGKVKHRKYAGLLTRAQFDRLIEETGMWAETTETLGSIGAPGFGYGLAPAISFRNDDPDAIQSMYVTPVPEVEPKRPVTRERGERVWDRVRNAVLTVYGNGR